MFSVFMQRPGMSCLFLSALVLSSPSIPAQAPSKAPAELRRRAEVGDVEAMVRLGIALEYGEGVKVDHVESLRWYLRSAEKGHPLGMSRLAWAYITGVGVTPDMDKGRQWCARAAEAGNSFSKARMAAYGWSRPAGFQVAYRWYRKSAEEGDPRGCYFTAKYLGMGRGGVAVDHRESAAWYRRGAERGDPGSMHQYGICLAKGVGVKRDEREGIKWLERSAERGSVHGMYSLGYYHYHGWFGLDNPREAVRLWKLAARSTRDGRDGSLYRLGLAYKQGRGVSRSLGKAAEWFRRAAEQGNADALYELGLAYRDGLGVQRSLEVSRRCFQMGSEWGNEDCRKVLQSSPGN